MIKKIAALAIVGTIALTGCGAKNENKATTTTAATPAASSPASDQTTTSVETTSSASAETTPSASETGAAETGSAGDPTAMTKDELIKAVNEAEKKITSVHSELELPAMDTTVTVDVDETTKSQLLVQKRGTEATEVLTVAGKEYVKRGGKWVKPTGIMMTIDPEKNLATAIKAVPTKGHGFKALGNNTYEVMLNAGKITIVVDDQNRITDMSSNEFTMKRSKFNEKLNIPKP